MNIQFTKLILKVFSLCMLVFVLGCGPQITKGRVVSKDFIPEYEDSISVDTNGDGLPDMDMPYTVPDRWYIVFENVVENHGKVQRRVMVSQQTHDNYQIGDWFEVKQ
ncbi:MAG: hypothetical protein DWQ19_09880 [Crenarchaeota archaeon]|nr:MAG: hypothetical protein DWQ19_09880 [Thermoproteota archaeon]